MSTCEIRKVNALQHELILFAAAIRGGEKPIVTGEDGRRALEVANAIMERIHQQKVIL